MKNVFKLLPIVLILLAVSCKKESDPNQPAKSEKFLHISHTRSYVDNYMVSEVEKINCSEFDMLWLGGDLTNNTTKEVEYISYVDSFFDLGNPNTLFSVGNHDCYNPALISTFTNRPLYYTYNKNNITYMILNTQDSLSNIVGEQKKMVYNVLDTIIRSSHLIILHHKLIWMYGNPTLQPQIPSISNGKFGDCYYCLNPNNFYEDIYPRLQDLAQQGIKVICIGGDIGNNTNEFEYITPDGIYFLASGIREGDTNNQVLILYHDIMEKDLKWEYQLISEL